ncbi:MAG: uracil-DNA glycosylase [Xanthobacteraceae bacterium]|nr:uracil-DNA glycosylase [Xanthobacteraceae bacterium]
MRKISKTEPNSRSGRARPGPAAVSDTLPPAATDSPGPERNCRLCPRLAAFRDTNRLREPSWFNAPVPPFGDRLGSLLVVGLAPGLQGANRTGRPFTGDYAGDLLYGTLLEFGFAAGRYDARPDDGLRLVDCRIGNAVHCVPPQNKPLPAEINTCRQFLAATRADMPRLRAVVMLGRIAHDSTIKVFGLRAVEAPFGHGREHQAGDVRLFDSYHCSRYNTNTGVLTADMFRSVFASVRRHLAADQTAGAASFG